MKRLDKAGGQKRARITVFIAYRLQKEYEKR
jgi:hypothetical protein